jgi:hypothetical protein
MPDSSNGPWVSFAVLCEKVIEDKVGRLSLINIVDQVNYAPPQGENVSGQIPAVTITLIAAVGFKAGVLKGPANIKLGLMRPNGEAGPTITISALFQGDERGTNVISEMNLALNEEGLYWLEVYVADQFMTRIPLRLAYQSVVFGPSS